MDEGAGDLEGVFDDWRKVVGSSEIGLVGVGELSQIAQLVRSSSYGPDRIQIDSSVVRWLWWMSKSSFPIQRVTGKSRAAARWPVST